MVVRLSDPVVGEETRPLTELTEEPRFLQGLFPLAERIGRLADSVESAYGQYHELVYLRTPLKLSFILTLSLVLLLSLFAAVWVALFSARRMVAPLRDVALGTRAVAAGDYETRLPPAGEDEVGFLVASFNEMTRELARARDATRRSQRQLEEQRGYLEAVLERLSNGVLTLDPEGRLHTANQAARQILGTSLGEHTGRTLSELAALHPHLIVLAERLEPHLEDPGCPGAGLARGGPPLRRGRAAHPDVQRRPGSPGPRTRPAITSSCSTTSPSSSRRSAKRRGARSPGASRTRSRTP